MTSGLDIKENYKVEFEDLIVFPENEKLIRIKIFLIDPVNKMKLLIEEIDLLNSNLIRIATFLSPTISRKTSLVGELSEYYKNVK